VVTTVAQGSNVAHERKSLSESLEFVGFLDFVMQ